MTNSNVLILTDIEGISGVDSIEAISQDSQKYADACERLMIDTNIAVAALIEAGADTVFVLDGHGKGENFISERLHPAAKQITIADLATVIKEICCVVLVGMHAMSGTLDAFLDHTQSSIKIHNYFYNGKRIGEISQIGTFAGYFGVPCVAVTGDSATCREAKELIDGVFTASVKTARGRNHAECIPTDEATARIYSAVHDGFIGAAGIKPMKVTLPLTVTVEFNRSDYCDEALINDPSLHRVDAFTATSVKTEIKAYKDVLL